MREIQPTHKPPKAHQSEELRPRHPAKQHQKSKTSPKCTVAHLLVHREDDVQALADGYSLRILRATLFRAALVPETRRGSKKQRGEGEEGKGFEVFLFGIVENLMERWRQPLDTLAKTEKSGVRVNTGRNNMGASKRQTVGGGADESAMQITQLTKHKINEFQKKSDRKLEIMGLSSIPAGATTPQHNHAPLAAPQNTRMLTEDRAAGSA